MFISESPLLRNIQEKLAGLLVIQVCDGRGELLYAHTTESMCIGYMSTKHEKPKVSTPPPFKYIIIFNNWQITKLFILYFGVMQKIKGLLQKFIWLFYFEAIS